MSLHAEASGTATRPASRASAFRPDRGPAASAVAIAVEPDFDFLSPAYGALFAGSGATAFQSPLWMHRLHRHLAPAVGAEALTIVVRERQGGDLLAVLPLMIQRKVGIAIVSPSTRRPGSGGRALAFSRSMPAPSATRRP